MSDTCPKSVSIDPSTLSVPSDKQMEQSPPGGPPDFGGSALEWYRFGLQVIPIAPNTKRTAVFWDDWLSDLSETKITQHWTAHPDHEVGFIVGDDLIVLDADSPEALKTLNLIEESHDAGPLLTVKTRKGEHHYFRRAKGTFAKSDAHSTEEHPERLDVKTGRAMVLLPPSTGKSILVKEAAGTNELSEVGQIFIDSVFLMNGREAPRLPKPPVKITPNADAQGVSAEKLETLLDAIDPDSGYEDWTKVIMAIYHETGGSKEGLDLADTWSRRGSKYKDRREIETKWRSFREVSNPVTIASLIKMARDSGADFEKIKKSPDPEFKSCETVVIRLQEEEAKTAETKKPGTVFDRYSLTGLADQLEKDALEQVPVLGQFALLGQTTVLCAEGNTGKTLIVLKLLTESIAAKRIDPEKTYYLNMDDDYRGLIDKTKIAEEFGFHMLAEGYQGFTARAFIGLIQEINRRNEARGVVIILDTLKKFVNLMQKNDCRDFNATLREFSSKGGTLIALAHVNKKRDANDRPVFAGTSDLKDDFDCMFLLWLISERGAKEKMVMLEKEKGRGPVVEKACYGYVSGKDISYSEMLLSVREGDEDRIIALEQAEAIRSDAEVIDVVIACIKEGINTKMLLAEVAAKRSGASKRSVLQLIEKYTGDDPAKHRWNFVRGERGKQIYSVLN